jgi:AraC-like DNA-binding protein
LPAGPEDNDVSDYTISIKVRNGRIRRKIAECGFSSVKDLCRKAGLRPQLIGALLNLKLPPLKEDGTWRRSAADLADVLGCTCEELFSETQRTLALRDNRGECFITEAELLKLSGRAERPLRENPGDLLLEDLDEQTKISVICRALNGLKLAALDRRIIEGHFGLGCDERTLVDLASELGLSPRYVQWRLNTTLGRLRSNKTAVRRSLLQAYQPADAMSAADEARIRVAQRRAAVVLAEKKAQTWAREQRIAQRQRAHEVTHRARLDNRSADGQP